jgi:chitodextrinase
LRRASLLGVLAFALLAPSAHAKTLNVSPTGSDSATCTATAPCKSFARAYAVAAAGDVVEVADGTYSRQDVTGGTKAVTFRGGRDVVVRQIWNRSSNVVYDGINVDAGGVKTSGAAFELGGSNVTVKNARVGNVVDEKGMLATGANLTVDNVTFHDAVYRTQGVHMECLYAIGVPGFTLRNSTFRDCAIMDAFFTYGSWWSPKPPAYGNVTIENNVFAHPERESNGGWHYYSLYVADTGPNGTGGDPMNGWVVRNNTFESPAFLSSSGGTNGTRWVNNLGSWDCKSGITYRGNVGRACSSADKAVSPSSSTASQPAPFGWVNPAAYDFHLRAGSPAVDAGVSDAPALDKDGNARNGAPDAGAYEYGGTSSPNPTPTPTPTPSPSPDSQAPSVPQGMAWTTITQTSIGLRWDASSDNVGVTGYRIYRNGTLVGTTTNTSYTVSGLSCGTSYTIALAAVDAAGNESYRAEATGTTSTSACSQADTQAPSVPQGMAWTTITQTSIGLRWDASTDNVGVTGYRIYRNGTPVATTAASARSYTVSGLQCGTSYTIGLTAIDAAGNESYRPEATGTTRTVACAAGSSARRASGRGD